MIRVSVELLSILSISGCKAYRKPFVNLPQKKKNLQVVTDSTIIDNSINNAIIRKVVDL